MWIVSNLLTDSEFKKKQRLEKAKKILEERKTAIRDRRIKGKSKSDNFKIEVVKTYLAFGGNAKLTCGAMNLSYNTINTWKHTSWWKNLVDTIRKEERLELSAKTKNILDKSMDLLADRVENGDFIYDQKKGFLVRKPIQAKDLHRITIDMIDRKEILDKETQSNENPESHQERVEKLMKQFLEVAQKTATKPTQQVNVTDVVFVQEKHTSATNEDSERKESS